MTFYKNSEDLRSDFVGVLNLSLSISMAYNVISCQQGSLRFRAVGRRVKNFEFSDFQNLSVFSNFLA